MSNIKGPTQDLQKNLNHASSESPSKQENQGFHLEVKVFLLLGPFSGKESSMPSSTKQQANMTGTSSCRAEVIDSVLLPRIPSDLGYSKAAQCLQPTVIAQIVRT